MSHLAPNARRAPRIAPYVPEFFLAVGRVFSQIDYIMRPHRRTLADQNDNENLFLL
jgi:hypothetical protein